MAEITDITVTKRGRFALFLDGEFAFSVDDETYVQERLQKGVTLTEEDILRLREETGLRYAKQQALRLLSYKDYTAGMMANRLMEMEIQEDIAWQAARRMEELGLINDLDYALRCSRDLVNLKRWGPGRVAAELSRRQVPAEYISQALEQFADRNTEKDIAQVILKKYFRDLDTPKGKNRAVAGLGRLGHHPGLVFTVIGNLLDDPDYYENE